MPLKTTNAGGSPEGETPSGGGLGVSPRIPVIYFPLSLGRGGLRG